MAMSPDHHHKRAAHHMGEAKRHMEMAVGVKIEAPRKAERKEPERKMPERKKEGRK